MGFGYKKGRITMKLQDLIYTNLVGVNLHIIVNEPNKDREWVDFKHKEPGKMRKELATDYYQIRYLMNYEVQRWGIKEQADHTLIVQIRP